ncbi:hypothetical protein HN51_035782 [Arachis hypogaea]|uniref:Protein SPEAR3 n=1 Tax=Arachis hypogaea TaxID=3818 RepID=A0A445A301_ARAHY|nr:protein SPEAR3-like isoform X1 [Arachis ipaensis]XP_025644137.1 protein SPEAR3 isoform X1 [Arachis hypogaea]QHO00967.1 uncharacterized protein DS421_13g410910 [Arachis hypogaea]RYR20820.1 hypothetical protein Ahy_B03g066058 [Arachis hypogaea]
MGSSYFGEANIERGASGGSSSCSSSSSSRKGKKKNSNSEKQPRQPQRGLGVAQLEKIRLHSQMAYAYHHRLSSYPSSSTFNNINDDPKAQMAAYSSPPSSSFSYSSSSTSYSPSYAFQTNITMGLTEYEKTNMRYGDSRSTNTARWENSNAGMLENQFSSQSKVTIPFQFLNLYGSHDDNDREKQRSGSVGSGSHNSESSEAQELDLELRLSL